MERIRCSIRGRVQGVGFRAFVAREARALGLAGGVCNRPDGSVDAWAEGPAVQLDAFLAALRAGPAHATVSEVRSWREPASGAAGFRIEG